MLKKNIDIRLTILILLQIIVVAIAYYVTYAFKVWFIGPICFIFEMMIFFIWIKTKVFKGDKNGFFLYLYSSISFVAILILLKYIVVPLCNVSNDNITNNSLLGFYGSILGSIIAAAVGVFGAILGAKVGGEKSYKGALEAVTKQIQYQNDLLNKEESKKKEIANKIVSKLLWNEIEYNCRTFDGKSYIFSKDKFLKTNPTQFGFGFTFKFDNYDRIKYELLKYNSEIIDDVVEIYFKMQILSSHIDLKELTQQEFERVKTMYTLKDKIKKFIDDSNNN